MKFLPENEYWKIRSKDGRDKTYDPETLLTEANNYFQWCTENQLQEVILHQRTGEKINMPKMRPFTIEGLCNYLDICVKTFNNYGNDSDYLHIITRIRQIIYNQKFEGAAAGFLNPNIIARDLGLVEKKENDNKHTFEDKDAIASWLDKFASKVNPDKVEEL